MSATDSDASNHKKGIPVIHFEDVQHLQSVADINAVLASHSLPKVSEVTALQHAKFCALKIAANDVELDFIEAVVSLGREKHAVMLAPDAVEAKPEDVFLPNVVVKKVGLLEGDLVWASVYRSAAKGRRPYVCRIVAVQGMSVQELKMRRPFEDLVSVHPHQRLLLETHDKPDADMRILDIVAPLGRGQRALLVAPPRTGKTVMLHKMAQSIIANHKDVTVMVLLIDERPEEVTHFKRTVPEAMIYASTFDLGPQQHGLLADKAIERAKRMVERGEHVVILLDSITRLARAYNQTTRGSGRILSGGIEAKAMQKPKNFFGAARAIDHGGSLTIIATSLIDTGSQMDAVIYEEFKGTGNAEVHLSRHLADHRTFPAIDIVASGTRRDDLLMDARELVLVNRLRKILADMPLVEGMDFLKNRINKTEHNIHLFLSMTDN